MKWDAQSEDRQLTTRTLVIMSLNLLLIEFTDKQQNAS